jgi:hypothetical protein
MLLLGSKSITVEGIQVFADHANPNQFWYLPGPVSLARDPRTREADFTFLKFRPARPGTTARGGGFLMFVVNLKPDPHLERRILARVAALAPGEPVVSPVQFDDGTVECIGLRVQGGGGTSPTGGPVTLQVVEQIQGSTVPSLAGYNDAAFSLSLTQEGATLLQDALKNLTEPVGAVYNLKYTGMRPALEVKITADYRRIFDQLTGGLSGQIYWVQASLEAGFEKLRQSGAIKIEVTNFTGQAEFDQKAQWALDFFRDRLVSQWFEPTLIPGQFAGGGALNVPGLDAATRGNALRPPPTVAPRPPGTGTIPSPQISPFLKPPTLGTGTGKLNLPGQGVATPAPAAPAGTAATAGTGNPPAPAASKPQTPATAGLKFNPTTPVNKGAPLQNMGSPSTPQVALRLKFIHQDELKTQTLEYRISEATQRTYAPIGFIGLLASDLDLGRHFREIDLDDPFYREFTVTVQAPIDYARLGLTSATIRLDYGDPVGDPARLKHTDFLFDAAHATDREWKVFLDQRLDTSYRYQVEYHYDPGSTWKARRWDYMLPERTTEDRTLFLNPYEDFAFLEVRVFPNRIDAGVITATDVVLSYTSPGGWTKQDVLTLPPAGDAQLWRLRLEDRDATAYTYHFVHHLKGGGTITTDPVTTSASALPVDDPFAGALDLTFVPVFDPAVVRFAFADVHYEDPANHYTRDLRVQFDGTSMAPVTQHLSLRDPARTQFTLRITIIGKNGSVSSGPAVTRTDTLIAVMQGA